MKLGLTYFGSIRWALKHHSLLRPTNDDEVMISIQVLSAFCLKIALKNTYTFLPYSISSLDLPSSFPIHSLLAIIIPNTIT